MTKPNLVKLGSRSPMTYFSFSSLSSKQLDQIGHRKHKTLAENVIYFISHLGLQKSRERIVPISSKSCQPLVGVSLCVSSSCLSSAVEGLGYSCIDHWLDDVQLAELKCCKRKKF